MLGLSASLVMLACAASAAQPVSLRSAAGRFTVRVAGIESPERLNHLHGFDLSIAANDGTPVSGALVSIGGEHRYARNPLPTAPQVSPGAAAGSYRVEGLRFHVPGQWHLFVDIESAQIHDRATLAVLVK